MNKKKVIYNIVAFVGIGIVFGLAIKYYRMLTFNFEVSAFDLFSLVVTVLIAWWVAQKLERDTNQERCEKDIIIEKLKMLDGLIERLNNKIVDEDIMILSSVTSIINSIDAHTNRIKEQIEKHYPSVLKTNVDFQNELDQLDDLCTNDKDGGMETIIIDENSVCQYTSERKNDIGLCANALSDKIFNLEILVNRA